MSFHQQCQGRDTRRTSRSYCSYSSSFTQSAPHPPLSAACLLTPLHRSISIPRWPQETADLSDSAKGHPSQPKMLCRGFLHCGGHAEIRPASWHNCHANGLARQAKALAVKAEDPSFLARTSVAEGENWIPPCVVPSPTCHTTHLYILGERSAKAKLKNNPFLDVKENYCRPRILYPARQFKEKSDLKVHDPCSGLTKDA